MSKRRDLGQERIRDIRKQIALMEGQRHKHRVVVDGEAGRRAYLGVEIQKRLDAIEVMRREIAELPVVIAHSRSVIAKLDDQISTFKYKIEMVKTKQRKKEQLARVREQIAEAKRAL